MFLYFQDFSEAAMTKTLIILNLHSEHSSYAILCGKTWSRGTQKHWKLTLFFSCVKYFKILFLMKTVCHGWKTGLRQTIRQNEGNGASFFHLL